MFKKRFDAASASLPIASDSELPPIATLTPPLLQALAPWFLAGLTLILFALRLAGPPDLLDFDQERPAAYALDALKNRHWFCQWDTAGAITSKPPLYTWCVAGIALLQGGLDRFSLYAPCAIATFGVAWLLWQARALLGARACFLAALAFVASPNSLKLVALARTDALFAFWVAAGALAAYRSWRRSQGWTWFWLAAAGATLTKGPLGILLAGLGLLAIQWEKRAGTPLPLRGSHRLGLLLFFVLVGGWFLLAYRQAGYLLVQKLIWQELFGHALRSTKGEIMGQGFYRPVLYFFPRFAPWSLFTAIALWRIARAPSSVAPQIRPFLRFLFCWFCGGLIIFSLSPHQRPDHLAPLIPAAALLAGWEIDRLFQRVPTARLAAAAGATACLLVLVAGSQRPRFMPSSRALAEKTRGLEILARSIREKTGPEFPLTHVDTPFAFQFFWPTHRQNVSFARAARLLQQPIPAFVMVQNRSKLNRLLSEGARPVELASWPQGREPFLSLWSNHPRLEWPEETAVLAGPFFLAARGVMPENLAADRLELRQTEPNASLIISNETAQPARFRLHLRMPGASLILETSLPPRGVWMKTMRSARSLFPTGGLSQPPADQPGALRQDPP